MRITVIFRSEYDVYIPFSHYAPNEIGRGVGGGGGILDSPCLSVRLSVRLSVDDMVSGV